MAMTWNQDYRPTKFVEDYEPWHEEENSPWISLMGQIPAGIWTTDLDLHITSVQGAGLPDSLFADASPGKLLAEALAAHPKDGILEAHRRARGGAPATLDFSLKGRSYFGQVNPLRDEKGKPVGTIALLMDVSPLRIKETDRRQQDFKEMEERKTQSLVVLAGGVAHNFNNLLTAILGYTSLALMKMPEDVSLRNILMEIEKAGRCAADLSGQMLIFSQKQRLNRQPVNLRRVLDAPFLFRLAGKKTALVRDLSGDLPLVAGDVDQLRRLLHNLLVNAAEAIGEAEGVITLKAWTQQADQNFLDREFPGENVAEGKYVLVQVRDTGCGMDEETRARMFEPFFSTKFTGRGLGLATCLGIIREYQGGISVASKPGKGTTIQVLLPALDLS